MFEEAVVTMIMMMMTMNTTVYTAAWKHERVRLIIGRSSVG